MDIVNLSKLKKIDKLKKKKKSHSILGFACFSQLHCAQFCYILLLCLTIIIMNQSQNCKTCMFILDIQAKIIFQAHNLKFEYWAKADSECFHQANTKKLSQTCMFYKKKKSSFAIKTDQMELNYTKAKKKKKTCSVQKMVGWHKSFFLYLFFLTFCCQNYPQTA